MFLKNCWYVAAFQAELDDQATIARQILGQRVLLYRSGDGAAVAMLDQCPHRLVPLSAGRRVGDAIQCAYHGMIFGTDGRCTHIPGQHDIPAVARVQTFPLVEAHGHAWIWMGDADLADPSLIPSIPWILEEGWGVVTGYLHVGADYRLLSDNLLDLSHETYIHEGTIGNQPGETIADYPVKVAVRDGQVVSASRVMEGIDPPPWFAMILDTQERIDRWQTAIWAVPSFNMTDTGAAHAGEDPKSGYVGRILHLLTPETETSTHYFWSVSRNRRIHDDALSEQIRAAVCRTFEEDRAILELQQRALSDTGLRVPRVAIQVDDAPLRARRILSSRIRKEEEGTPPPAQPTHLIQDGDRTRAA